MGTLDPTGLLIYKILLVLAGLLLLAGLVALVVWIVRQLASFTSASRTEVDNTVGWLSGKKTHLVNLAGGLATVLWTLEYLPDKTYWTLAALLGFTAMSTLRSGTAKTEQMAAQASEAANEAASIAATTQATVKRAPGTVTPARVEAPAAPPTPAPVPKPREE